MRAAYYPHIVGEVARFRMPIASNHPVPERGPSERLKLSIVGGFSLTCGSRRLPLFGRKAQALIGHLALTDVERVSRESLVGLLWSSSGEHHARGSLRHSLLEVQTVLRGAGVGPLKSDKLMIGLDRSYLDVDLWDVLDGAKAGKVHPLLLERGRICDSILAGLDAIDPAFGSWLQAARQNLQNRLAGYLEGALPPEDVATVAPAAETVARALAMLDPANERAARLIIRSRWAAGDIGTALRTYDKLWKHLEQEFDAEPSPETQDLIASLKLSQPEATAPVAISTAPREMPAPILGGYDARPSIAVLPFTTIGPADERYFGDGIVDDIIHAMAGLKDLFVIAKGSTRNYRGTAPDVRSIGRDLGVRYVLYGNVQRAGDHLRIRTTLAETETGEIVKPSRYDGKLADLFDLQDQIAVETTKAIAPFVRERELRRAMRKHPQSMTAYDLVLQAVDLLDRLDYASFSRARGLLQSASFQDPTYSPALYYAAWWHAIRIAQGWSTDLVMDGDEAIRLATTAISLDSKDGLALATFGQVNSLVKKNFDVALASFDRALAASPNLAISWTLKAITLSFIGDGEGAVECARKGIELSPADVNLAFSEHILSQAYYVTGDYAKAIEWGRQSAKRNEKRGSNLRILAASFVANGLTAEANSIGQLHQQIAPEFRVSSWILRTPFTESIRDVIAQRLRLAGLPD